MIHSLFLLLFVSEFPFLHWFPSSVGRAGGWDEVEGVEGGGDRISADAALFGLSWNEAFDWGETIAYTYVEDGDETFQSPGLIKGD